jgi:outer membrane receptor for monomeric catechols
VFRLGHGNTWLEKGVFYTYDTKRPQYTFSEDTNFFKQNWAGGDHEFKFGFAYKRGDITSLTQYGGDVILYDFTGNPHDQSAGFGLAKFRYGDVKYNITGMGAYVGDTWRMNRLTLNLGVRFDHHTTKALASSQDANKIVPDLLPALSFSGAMVRPSMMFHRALAPPMISAAPERRLSVATTLDSMMA